MYVEKLPRSWLAAGRLSVGLNGPRCVLIAARFRSFLLSWRRWARPWEWKNGGEGRETEREKKKEREKKRQADRQTD